MSHRSLLAALALAVLVLAGCSADDSWDVADAEPAGEQAVDDHDAADTGGGDADGGERGEAVGSDRASPGPLGEQRPPRGERVIKEGSVTVEVANGGFDAAYGALVRAARDLGGNVSATTSSTGADGATWGAVTLRVPVDRYEELLVGVTGVGAVVGRDISSQDVSTEFTDLESRLRHLRAQEQFFLGLLDEAPDVRSAIEVQRELEAVTGELERIQGRLAALDDRTMFSTLTVEIVEEGADVGPVRSTGTGPSLGAYLDEGLDAFVRVLGVMLLLSIATAPFTVPVALALLIWWARRRARRTDRIEAARAGHEDPRTPVSVGAPPPDSEDRP